MTEAQQAEPSARQAQPTQFKAGSEVVKDDINGFSFHKPDGWNHQQGDGQILLGSNTVAGLISVFPHQAQNMQEMQVLMQQGIQEEGVYLSLSGDMQQTNQQQLVGSCSGYVQNEQAKGHVIGLLSPHEGGIFILAVTTPEKLGQEIIAAANSIAQHTTFQKQSAGDRGLVQHFSGEWAWTNGYRTSWMIFFPNGSYSDQYEAAYSGNFNDELGNVTGNWGATNQEKNQGRWSIHGNKDSGVITVINPNGTQDRYEYSVFVERGQKFYREYIINGYHYSKNKDY
jgi:hypothetical protein